MATKKKPAKKAPAKKPAKKKKAPARKTKAQQVELEEAILIEEHELGLHDADSNPDCVLCLEEEEIDPEAPRPGAKRKRAVPEKKVTGPQLIINEIDVIADLRAGANLADLCKRIGMKRGKLRRAVDKVLGKGGYSSLRDEGKMRLSGDVPAETKKKVSKLDKGVPRIPGARIEDGWKIKTLFVNYGGKRLKNLSADIPHDPSVAESLIISPDGDRYVMARPSEAADLIIDDNAVAIGLDPVRLRKMETSSIYHLVKEHEELVEQGEKALERTREAKKKSRVRRKGGLK